VQGIAYQRLVLILAVLQKRCGISFNKMDVFVNVVGGISLSSGGGGNSQDLAVAIALVSSLLDIPVRSDTAFVGEIGLLGELRSVPSLDKRIGEARRMGFSRVVVPMRRQHGKKGGRYKGSSKSSISSIEVLECVNVLDAINEGLTMKLTSQMQKRGKKSYTKPMHDEYYDKKKRQWDERMGSPGSMEDLHLDDEIIDDDDDFAFE